MEKPDYERHPWMHVYGAWCEHGEVTIKGNAPALAALKLAIEQALENGTGASQAVASDGEGYSIHVRKIALMSELGEAPYIEHEAWKISARDYKAGLAWKRFVASKGKS